MFASSRIFHANSNAFCRRTYDNFLQMLQCPMRSQLARLSTASLKSVKMEAHKKGATFGPITDYLDAARNTLELLQNKNKLWQIGQYRSLALAAVLLERKEVIALPTDTLYGLACLANESDCIQKLYDIKGRDASKPIAICLGKLEDIPKYGIVEGKVSTVINLLLPGPYTIILKRTELVNKDLNPNHDTIGIRIPNYWFTRNVVEIAGPIALTSANKSGQTSCININEFSDLWPQLGGVFNNPYQTKAQSSRRGSTIIDLSVPGKFRIVRGGVSYGNALKVLHMCQLEKLKVMNEDLDQDVPAVLNA